MLAVVEGAQSGRRATGFTGFGVKWRPDSAYAGPGRGFTVDRAFVCHFNAFLGRFILPFPDPVSANGACSSRVIQPCLDFFYRPLQTFSGTACRAFMPTINRLRFMDL